MELSTAVMFEALRPLGRIEVTVDIDHDGEVQVRDGVIPSKLLEAEVLAWCEASISRAIKLLVHQAPNSDLLDLYWTFESGECRVYACFAKLTKPERLV